MSSADTRGITHGERGAALPIAALLAFALIAVLAILGYDTSRVKSEGALLQRRVENLCRATARHALVSERAIKVFSLYASGIQLTPGTKISAAKLTLPFALNGDISGELFDTGARQTCQGTLGGHPPYSPDSSAVTPIPFHELNGVSDSGGALGAYTCSNHQFFKQGVDCVLVPSACTGGQPNPNYPPSMWSDVVNAGNTVGCEIEAEVPPLLPFLPTRFISAKAAWWSPLKTLAPYLDPENGGDGPTGTTADYAGLSIGIGTELTTWGGELPNGPRIGDERFRFMTLYFYDSAIHALDPRRPIEPGYPRPRFTFNNPGRSYPADTRFNVPIFPSLANPGENTPAQHEMLTACFNPLVLARNLLVSTLVDFASRSGQTRNMTEIAHINPRHQSPEAPPNRPVVMVPFGEDLMSERFQAPFVTYNSGGHFDKGGFITPWENFGGQSTRTSHHAFIAQQLRACYHLYKRNAGVDGEYYPPWTIMRFPPPLSQGTPELTAPAFRVETLNLHSDVLPPKYWDYSAPWQTSVPDGNGRLLTAPELIYSLGSTQACPVDKTAASNPQGAVSLNCSKEELAQFDDLIPDVRGYLRYQRDGGNRAYRSPGLSPPLDEDGEAIAPLPEAEQPHLPAPQGDRTATSMPRSTVVVVVHKPLEETEVEPVKSIVQDLNAQKRPVIIIYMPSTYADSQLFSNYCRALGLGITCSKDGEISLNSFVFLSPFNSVYGDRYRYLIGTGDASDAPLSEDYVFIKYWSDLVMDDPTRIDDPYYLDIARTLFVDTILKLEPKL